MITAVLTRERRSPHRLGQGGQRRLGVFSVAIPRKGETRSIFLAMDPLGFNSFAFSVNSRRGVVGWFI
jgi:hypothetical protein